MANLIKRLDGWLRSNRPDYYSHLLAGASEKEILDFEKELDFSLTDSFKDFLRWKNGQSGDDIFFDNWSLLSCNEILGFWRLLNEWQDDGAFEVKNWWNRNWVPFLFDKTGNSVCIDVAGTFTGKSGQILYFWHDDNSRNIIHDTFYKWLETIVLAMERDLIYYGQAGQANTRYRNFARQNNPGYPIKIYLKEDKA